MKINNLIIFTHIVFGIILIIFLVRIIFFGSDVVWLLFNLAIYFNIWAALEKTKEKIRLQREIKRLKEKYGRNM